MYGVGAAVPGTREGTALLSQYDCAGSAGTSALVQDFSIASGTHFGRVPAFGFCFSSPIVAGHIVQHLAECKAHAVALLLDVNAY